MRVFRWVALLIALPAVARAQTAAGSATWQQLEAPAVASTYTYTLKNTNVTTIAPLTATCVANPSGGSNCSAPVPSALMVAGTFTLTATNGFSTATSAPFTPGTVSTPGTFTITVTITFAASSPPTQ